jgi:hypothetical protein
MPRNSSKALRNGGQDRKRQLVAQETARIIVTQGIRDYRVAKRKAADRLGFTDHGSLPGNGEIEQAIGDYHLIFGGADHPVLLDRLRSIAVQAMDLLEAWSPRLVGPVLNGTADENSAINLHVFCDSAEAIGTHLDAAGMVHRSFERRLKFRKDRVAVFPGYEFELEHRSVQVTVFPFDGIRQAPLSPVDGRPMQRADRRAVLGLLSPTES